MMLTEGQNAVDWH